MVEPDCSLNEIETLWSDVSQAHSGEPAVIKRYSSLAARRLLMI